MSDCRICDTCGAVFSVLDIDARRMRVEEPVRDGARVEVQVTTRDMCGLCVNVMTQAPKRAAIAGVADPNNVPTAHNLPA